MYEYRAIVVRVVDGDTFDAVVDLGFRVQVRHRFRVLGINTPEMKGNSRDDGKKSKARARELLEGLDIKIMSRKADSFGRWLCDVELSDGRDFGSIMIEENLANKYEG